MKKVDYIAGEIEERINSENLRDGTPLPSTNDIAEDYGVSYVTAYRAVSKLVEKNVVYRITGKGTFVRKSTNSRKTIGMFWQTPDDMERARMSFVRKGILLGVSKKAGEKRFNVRNIFLSNYVDGDFWELDFVLSIPDIWVDGRYSDILKTIKCPHLCLSMRVPPVSFCNNLCVDMHILFKQALEYLGSLGYKNIGFVDHRDDRAKSFMETKQLLSYPHHPNWIISSKGFNDYQSATDKGKELAGFILEQCPEMDAVVSISDHVAFGLYQKVRESGKRFGIIGTDNVEASGFMSPLGEPVLTCVAASYWEIGERAVDLLEELYTRPGSERTHILVEPKLIKRKSCGEV